MLKLRIRRGQGFTLIELLVVIAIIAILASILLPVFATARERARSSSCSNNMKQIALAIITYEQDYDEKFPPSRNGNTNGTPAVQSPFGNWTYGNGQPIGWVDAIYPLIKSTGVFHCPDTAGQIAGQTGVDGPTGASSYCLNEKIGADAGNPQDALNISAVNWPASTIMIAEASSKSNETSMGSNNQEWGYTGTAKDRLLGDNNGGVPPLTRHNGGGANYAFTDGHVKFIQASKMGLQTPGVDPGQGYVDSMAATNDGSLPTYCYSPSNNGNDPMYKRCP